MELTVTETRDVRLLIKDHLISEGRMIKWVAAKIDISPSHLVNILSLKRALTEENRQKINEALETNF